MTPLHRIIVCAVFLAFAFNASAFTPGSDHYLFNASSGPIGIDIHTSSQSIDHFGLAPGQSLGFNGEIISIQLRLASKPALRYTAVMLRELVASSGASAKRGGWLIEDTGLRFVSERRFNLAHRRLRHG
jgi:hypothetical protein